MEHVDYVLFVIHIFIFCFSIPNEILEEKNNTVPLNDETITKIRYQNEAHNTNGSIEEPATNGPKSSENEK